MGKKEIIAPYRITDLQETERPRERLAERGADALSNAELLAILLRVGIPGENAVQLGQRLLNSLGGLMGLHRASFLDVRNQHGVGTAKAAQIKAAIELGNRLRLITPEERPAVNSPEDGAALVQYEMSALDHEELWVILLNTRNQMLAIEKVYKGSLNSSIVRIGELFRAAIQRNAAAIILVHNHPSGDPTPSAEDIGLTRAVVQAGKLLDIDVLDHLVIGSGRHVSLKERNLGF
ncbi:MAG: DNA repair protein RadC [Anaerolineaceae bacterium]|nr:DNA repair protein RadC [Anaerolineaceae bacterium]